MDFFEQQQRARRKTALMVFLFLLAVAAIVLAVDLVLAVAWTAVFLDTGLFESMNPRERVPPQVYLGGAIAALAVIAAGSLYRMLQLSQGGAAVAEMVGARRVAPDARDALERRLLNVVQEMAIASGITMPLVYVMDGEQGINAFAAGYSPNEAAITVTRGALEKLSRDELQGVIGHEYSHILNGDMRLNVRLLGVIAGIVVIGAIGRTIMEAGQGRSDSGGKRRAGDARIFLAGLALFLIGWIGVFFGRLIKAAVSREREYLADAASVQFTRNPEGIAGALYSIGQSSGSIANRHAEELSHMYFSQALASAWNGLFDTHPPLEDRIKRVLGGRRLLFLRGRARKTSVSAEGSAPEVLEGAASAFGGAPSGAAVPAMGIEWGRRAGDETISTSAGRVVDSVGNPTLRHMDYARALLLDLPAAVREAIGSVEGAQAALFALLVAPDGEARERQAAMIAEDAGESIAAQVFALEQALRPLGVRARLPVLELALPALRDVPQARRDQLLARVKLLIEADRRVTLFEFVLVTICRRHFAPPPRGVPPVKHRSAGAAADETAIVLSLLAHAGQAGRDAFDRALATLGITGQRLREPAELKFPEVETALYELKLIAPLAKPALIKAGLALVMADDTISVAEGELMRAICAALDTPLPPVLGN